MVRSRFAKGATYLYKGDLYLVLQTLLDDHLLVENQTSGRQLSVSRKELVDAWSDGDLCFTLKGTNPRSGPQLRHLEYAFADFAGLLPSRRNVAWQRYELIRPYLSMSAAERGAAWRTRDENQSATPTSRTIRRWLELFIDHNYDIRALVPKTHRRGGKGRTRIAADVETVIDAVLDEKRTLVVSSARPAVSLDDIQSLILVRIHEINLTRDEHERLKPPSRDTVHNRIHARGLEYILRRALSREELRALTSVEAGPNPTRIYERIEIDQTVPDLIVVDDEDRLPIGRPYLTTAIDCYSGYPAGWYVGYEPDSARTVQACLLHTILPGDDARELYGTQHRKLSYGLPETLIVDNGKCFVGQDLKDACASLGIVLEQMPVQSPWMKGRIERLFRSQNDGLLHQIPGTTFSNILARGDYDPMKHACISLSTFRKLLHIFLLDIYAERPHKGVRGIPRALWEASEKIYPPALPHTIQDTRIMLLSTEYRNVQRYGIDFSSLRYQSDALMLLRYKVGAAGDKQVKLKYDPGDLGRIWVLDCFDHRWLEVPVSGEYRTYAEGLSLWKHRVIREYARRNAEAPDLFELARAKVEIQRIVAEEFTLRAKRGRTRKAHARYLEVGRAAAAPPQASSAPPAKPALPLARSNSSEQTGWGGSYSLPRKTRDDLESSQEIH